MVNYSNGKIYCIEPICNHDEGDVYVGSTTKDLLCKRMVEHRSAYKRYKNGFGNYFTVYDIFDKYGLSNCKICLIELYDAKCKDDLHAREGEFVKELNCVNKNIPNRTINEWLRDNSTVLKEKYKTYYGNNKEHILQYHKDYYLNNRKSVLEKQKEYSKQNKERINKYRNEHNIKVVCPCGSSIGKFGMCHHIKTNKHQTYLQNNINNAINEP